MIERRFTAIGTLYWYDLDRSEPIETATDETLRDAGYVPAADLAAAESRATTAEREREQWRITADDSIATAQDLRAKLAEAQAENTRFHEAFVVERDCVVRDLRARLDRYAALESAVRDWRMEQASIPEGAAAKRLYALTPAPSAPKPETCGECESLSDRGQCLGSGSPMRGYICPVGRHATGCPAFTRRLPVVQRCADDCANFGKEPCASCWGRTGPGFIPRPAAQGVDNG